MMNNSLKKMRLMILYIPTSDRGTFKNVNKYLILLLMEKNFLLVIRIIFIVKERQVLFSIKILLNNNTYQIFIVFKI